MLISDEELEYWAEEYIMLDKRYRINVCHRIGFAEFLQNAEHNSRWIPVYAENRGLFERVLLTTFLQHPDEVLLALLTSQVADDTPRPLLKKQRVVAHFIEWLDGLLLQQQYDRQQKKQANIHIRNGIPVQPMKNYHPTSKRKTKGIGAHL